MTKWESITAIMLITGFFIAVVGSAVSEERTKVALAKQGLEECPNLNRTLHTIWVKDCSKYLESHNKIKGK